MPDESKERVYGPYEQGGRFRVVVVRDDGTQRSKKFKSRTEANRFIDSIKAQTSSVTMRESVDAYVKSLAESGLKFGTYTRAEFHLKKLLQLETNGGRSILWARNRGQELYDAVRVGLSVDSHRNALAAGKSWGRYCVKKGWLRVDPFADVEGVGRRKKGKRQLRVDEARELTEYVLRVCADEIKPEPVAVLTALLLGPRASEVTNRDVRDLDDKGRLLWIPDSKTESGKRMLEVPEVLRPLLLGLAKDRIGAAPLFLTTDGERPTRHWMNYWCKRICKLAGLKESISPQGFRGTHGSFARRAGATGELVAAQLGHASTSMTEGGAYVRREAIDAAMTNAVAIRVMKGGR